MLSHFSSAISKLDVKGGRIIQADAMETGITNLLRVCFGVRRLCHQKGLYLQNISLSKICSNNNRVLKITLSYSCSHISCIYGAEVATIHCDGRIQVVINLQVRLVYIIDKCS